MKIINLFSVTLFIQQQVNNRQNADGIKNGNANKPHKFFVLSSFPHSNCFPCYIPDSQHNNYRNKPTYMLWAMLNFAHITHNFQVFKININRDQLRIQNYIYFWTFLTFLEKISSKSKFYAKTSIEINARHGIAIVYFILLI